MKTFDIAKKYLGEVDFTGIDVFDQIDNVLGTPLEKNVQEKQKLFLSDPLNNVSNEYYRNMIFAACIYHLVELAHGRQSYWDVACTMVETQLSILETEFDGFQPGSRYPKVMIDQFLKYCGERSPQPPFLNDKSEIRIEFFMAAFHYVVDDVS